MPRGPLALQGNGKQWRGELRPTRHPHLAWNGWAPWSPEGRLPSSPAAHASSGSWIFAFSPEENALWEMDGDTWGPRAVTSVKRRLKTFWRISLPLATARARGWHLIELESPVLHTQLLTAWQPWGKGNYRWAGLETLLWSHLSFRCPRESFQPPGIEAVSKYRCSVCLSCFCLCLNTRASWKSGVGHCKQFWL